MIRRMAFMFSVMFPVLLLAEYTGTNSIIVAGVTGGVTGEVVYSMQYNMVEKIAAVLAPGLEGDQLKEEFKDIIGELANMITGNAMNLFSSSGKEIEITTPTVIEGSDVKITMMKPDLIWKC